LRAYNWKISRGEDHRVSVFRKHVGFAILNRDKIICYTWDKDSSSIKYKTSEYEIEKKVSKHIKIMPFLWVEVDDDSQNSFNNGLVWLKNVNI